MTTQLDQAYKDLFLDSRALDKWYGSGKTKNMLLTTESLFKQALLCDDPYAYELPAILPSRHRTYETTLFACQEPPMPSDSMTPNEYLNLQEETIRDLVSGIQTMIADLQETYSLIHLRNDAQDVYDTVSSLREEHMAKFDPDHSYLRMMIGFPSKTGDALFLHKYGSYMRQISRYDQPFTRTLQAATPTVSAHTVDL
jgi:hypothetical protein